MIRINFTIITTKTIKFNKTASNIKKNLSIKLIMIVDCANNLLLNNIKENLKKAIIKISKSKMIKNIQFKMVMVKIKDREMVIKDDNHLLKFFKSINQSFI
jgi:hypothetical protein